MRIQRLTKKGNKSRDPDCTNRLKMKNRTKKKNQNVHTIQRERLAQTRKKKGC